MNNENDYEQITKIIKERIKARGESLVFDLINFSIAEGFNRLKVESVIKRLVRLGQLVPDSSRSTTFGNQIVNWKDDSVPTFPQKINLNFEELKICLTLPAFNIHGLTDFLTNKQVEINALKKEFENLFRSATTSIKICSPFLDWKGYLHFHDTLLPKAKSKVKIQILTREINKNENLNRYETLRRVFALFSNEGLEDSIDIRNYYFRTEENRLASSIHAKLIIADNNKAYIGSGEIRENSFTKNLEIGVILKGEKVRDLAVVFYIVFSK
jgi:HKD family nuclease